MNKNAHLLGAAAAYGAKKGLDKFTPVREWADGIRARDRHAIINGQRLEPVPAPPKPAPTPPSTKSWGWLIPGLIIWLAEALLCSIFAAVVQTTLDQTSASYTPPFFAFIFTFFLSSGFFFLLGCLFLSCCVCSSTTVTQSARWTMR